MRQFLIFNLVVILIILVRLYILNNKVRDLEYEKTKLQFMIEDVVNYSDSTADTGEFDEFIASPQGERFFDNYHKLYDK